MEKLKQIEITAGSPPWYPTEIRIIEGSTLVVSGHLPYNDVGTAGYQQLRALFDQRDDCEIQVFGVSYRGRAYSLNTSYYSAGVDYEIKLTGVLECPTK